MTQEGSKKTIEEIRAEFMEIPTEKGPDAESKELAVKILKNNLKLCLLAEQFEQNAGETHNQNQNDPKIELLKNGKAALEILKQLYAKKKADNSNLRDDLLDLKLKRKEKRFFDKNKGYYAEYREKVFPILMHDCDKKEQLIDELNKNACGNISDKDLRQVTRELEKITRENERLKKTEEDIIETRRNNEIIEVETCRIQVRNIEMENEIRLFDEFVLENQIVELQEKIKNVKEAKLKQKEEMNKEEFKNPNNFPTLLDFLDKSKKLKQKSKRKLTSPSRPPSKRRKNKTGSYSQHDNNGKLQNSEQSQAKSSSQVLSSSPRSNRQLGSRGSSRNQETNKVRVMESYGLKKKTAVDNNSANLKAQTSNESGNMLQRTFASTNLGKVRSPRPTLHRQNPVMQMPQNVQQNRKQSSLMTNDKTPNSEPLKSIEDYETDEDGHLLLQRFPSRSLFPEEPEIPNSSRQVPPKTIQKDVAATKNSNPPVLMDKTAKTVETSEKSKDGLLEQMDTDMNLKDASVTKQPSVRGLRPRKNLKSPKKVEKCDKKKVKSPTKKEAKKRRGRKKVAKSGNNEMLVDDDSSSADDINNENEMIVDDSNLMTSGNNADKLMAVDQNPISEGSGNSNSNTDSSNAASIVQSTENNVMDIDQNVQNPENISKMPEISPNAANEINMEKESPGNDKDISNIEIFDFEMENVDPNKTGEDGSIVMSNSFERLFGSSPNTSGNLDLNQSFDFNFDNSRESDGTGNGGNKEIDDFFNFDSGNNNKEDFFGNGSFKSNEGTADDFF